MAFPLALRTLVRNYAAGARLALFLPVRPLDFRIGPAEFAVLFLANMVVWFAGAMARTGFPGMIAFDALPLVLMQIPLLLVTALLIARIYGNRELLLALAVMWISGDWLFEVVLVVLVITGYGTTGGLIPGWLVPFIFKGYVLWSLAVLWRAIVIAAGRDRRPLLRAGGVVTALYAFFFFFVPRAELWVPQEPDVGMLETPSVSIADEEIFHLQPTLLARAAAALERERPGVTDLYFLGVAPYASQDVFVRELTAVQRILADGFDTAGRSLLLVNSERTLREQPIASATNLRTALGLVAQTMNPDEDVLLLFLTTHGDTRHTLLFDLPPLQLQQLTPPALSRMLNASGIKWKILVVSACYSGGFVEPLKDANTIVITAADDSNTSFGCEHGRDWTYFGEAFFREALAGTRSFIEAFETARRSIAQREAREGLAPSSPQIHVGPAIREKLAQIESRLSAVR